MKPVLFPLVLLTRLRHLITHTHPHTFTRTQASTHARTHPVCLDPPKLCVSAVSYHPSPPQYLWNAALAMSCISAANCSEVLPPTALLTPVALKLLHAVSTCWKHDESSHLGLHPIPWNTPVPPPLPSSAETPRGGSGTRPSGSTDPYPRFTLFHAQGEPQCTGKLVRRCHWGSGGRCGKGRV